MDDNLGQARQHSVADHHQQWMPQAMNADAAKSIDIESLMKILRRNHKMVVVPFIPLERSLAQVIPDIVLYVFSQRQPEAMYPT